MFNERLWNRKWRVMSRNDEQVLPLCLVLQGALSPASFDESNSQFAD
jgi:hypothetical protein